MGKRLFYYLFYRSGIYKAFNRRKKSHTCAILNYHRVCPVDKANFLLRSTIVEPGTFESQIRYIKACFKIISLDELSDCLRKQKAVSPNSAVVTFDDAYEDNYRYAFPILKKYAVPATIFMPTAFIEGERLFWWERLCAILNNTSLRSVNFQYDGIRHIFKFHDGVSRERSFRDISLILKQASLSDEDNILDYLAELLGSEDVRPYCRALSWSQIKEMRQYGITPGAHTHTHRNLSILDKSELAKELNLNREILEYNLKEKICSFAYPYGEANDFNADTVQALIAAGLKNAVTMIQGLVSDNCDIYRLKRIGIGSQDTQEMFRLKVDGLIPMLSICAGAK